MMGDAVAIGAGLGVLAFVYVGAWLVFSRRARRPMTSSDLEARFHLLQTEQQRSRERSAF